MRPIFEKSLHDFNEFAKDEAKGLQEGENLQHLLGALEYRLQKASEQQGTDVEVQREIFALQKRKQEIMDMLRDDLASLRSHDVPFEQDPFKRREATYDEAEKNFVYTTPQGKTRKATFGQMLADLDWGIYYNIRCDDASPFEVYSMKKKYLVACAKQELRTLLDTQIIKSETSSSYVDDSKKKAYHAVLEERENGVMNERTGFISEKIVRNLLTVLNVDNRFPFEIVEADVFQDVEQKIDFVLRRKERGRGVRVLRDEEVKEQDGEVKEIGIQFTVAEAFIPHKRQQVAKSVARLREENSRIQDIALVAFPITYARVLQQEWKEKGKPSGGPGLFLIRSEVEKLFRALLKEVLPPEEIDQYWDSVKDTFV